MVRAGQESQAEHVPAHLFDQRRSAAMGAEGGKKVEREELKAVAERIVAFRRSAANICLTSSLLAGWAGCAPPKGDNAHRYVFQLFALDLFPSLGAHCGRTALVEEMRGHVLGLGLLTGTYQRK